MKKFFTKKNIIIAGISAAIVAVALCVVLPPVCDAYFFDTVTAGVNLHGENLSGKSEAEVSAYLDEMIASPKETSIKVSDKTITLDMNSAGFTIERERTIAEIMKLGKHNFLDAFLCRWQNWYAPIVIHPDFEMFSVVTETLLEQEGLTEQRFDYTINEDKAEIVIRPDVESYALRDLFEQINADYPNVKSEYTLVKSGFVPVTASEITEQINTPVADARIDEQDGRKVVVPHQVGLLVDEAVLQEKLASGEPKFFVPVTVLKPSVYTDDLSDDIFPHRLATYSTNYKEREVDRTANVKLAAQKVNGTVLNHGDIFSFNQVVGKRSYENGFRDAKIFLADKVVDGTGGGICQVSSTIYPAVLYSDLKIVERRNHNFVVNYAKPGIDATVVYGSIDFKFQNSLQNPVKIKAFASNGVMTVEIWGTKENNNTVEITTEHLGSTARGIKYEYNESVAPGEQVVTQSGYDGVKARAYRIVKDENGAVIRTDNLGVSNYVPLVKIIQTSDLGLVKTGIPTEIPVEETPEAEGIEPTEGEVSPEPSVPQEQTPEETETPVETASPEENAQPSEAPVPTPENIDVSPEQSTEITKEDLAA